MIEREKNYQGKWGESGASLNPLAHLVCLFRLLYRKPKIYRTDCQSSQLLLAATLQAFDRRTLPQSPQ